MFDQMERYLYYLAETKYRMYHELYVFQQSAYKEEECQRRIRTIHKYEMVLEAIAMLPLEEQLQLVQTEKDFFSDAPYVSQ